MILYIVVCVLGLGAYLWWQGSIQPDAEEVIFAVRESDPLRLARGEGNWAVLAREGLKPSTLRTGAGPETLGSATPVVYYQGGYHAAGTPAPHRRYFYEVDLEDGHTYRAFERWLPLEGASNFRDLGGYETAGGRQVAWGRLYRSDDLSRLTEDDLRFIRELGIQLVCDLRSDAEAALRPDRLPEGLAYYHQPVFNNDPIGRLRLLFARHRLGPALLRMYRTSIIDQGAPVLGKTLKLAADPANLPLLFHCTSGKDRTGVAAALLLHICGVPWETIVADYSLTNLYARRLISAAIQDAAQEGLSLPGLRIEQIYPIFSARPAILEYAFAHIEKTYDSVDAYLRGPAGLAEADMTAIRENLLVSAEQSTPGRSAAGPDHR